MEPNQSSSSTNYSQQALPLYMGNQLAFNIDNNLIQQIMNMKQEIEQLKANQNIQNIKHQIEMNQMKQNMFNQEYKHNVKIKNLIKKFQHQETMLREEIRVQNVKSQARMDNRFNNINKEISDLKANYSNLNQEISNIKKSEDVLNSIKPLLKDLSNNLTSFNEKKNSKDITALKKRVDDIQSKIFEFLKDNTKFKGKIETLCQQISLLINEINAINSKFNGEIKILERQVKVLSQKNYELQLIIISRKIVKIILKYIISNCLLSFTLENKSNNISSIILKGLAPFKQEDVLNTLNELIKKNRSSNKVMYIEIDIYNNLEILKGYGKEIFLKDLINILNAENKTKFSLNQIATFFNIANINVYNDIIFFDPDITEMLNDLQLQLRNKYKNNFFLK